MRKEASTVQCNVRKMAGKAVFIGKALEAELVDDNQRVLSGLLISACGGGGGCGGCGGGRPPQALFK